VKTFASFRWVFLTVAVTSAFFWFGAIGDLNELRRQTSGARGFFSGMVHGFIGDTAVVNRIGEASQRLEGRVYFWKVSFYVSLVLMACSGAASGSSSKAEDHKAAPERTD
jgi:hypothetical protein